MTQNSAGRRGLAAVQGGFYLATGLWPLLHMPSFLAVTGPKIDLWLVNTVGVLIAATGVVLLVAAFRGRVSGELILLAVGDALGLTAIDTNYALADRISDIYLLDAAAELGLVAAWIVTICKDRRQSSGAPSSRESHD